MKSKILIFCSLSLIFTCTACHFSSRQEEHSSHSEISEEDYITSSTSTEEENPEPIYDEMMDSLEGVDTNDFGGLYAAFSNINENYTSSIKGYFNDLGSYDYYRHYQKNYICHKTSFFTEQVTYTLPESEDYLSVCNSGFINLNSNYYSFSLVGSSKEERMNYQITNSDLRDEVLNKRYQDDLFTISDLNQLYFETHNFTRISQHKYQCTSIEVCEQFIDICAPELENNGHYLTFSRVTIETAPSLRIRLYVSTTQLGKLIDSHKDMENKPNWYGLFSEATISDIGTTSFVPSSTILGQ